jgi:hypothetical protein
LTGAFRIYVEEGAVRLAACFRIFLSMLVVQPTFAHAAPRSTAEVRSTPAGKQTLRTSYVVDFNWSQIERLLPGTQIMVRKPGVAVVRHYVLAVKDDEVKTLAVSDMAVEFAKPLRKAAVAHPEYLLQPPPAGTRIVLDDRVSLNDSGVFVGGRRVAELQQFIVTISRREIDSGSATLSTVPVNQLTKSGKILIGVGIGLAAWFTFMLILISQVGIGD